MKNYTIEEKQILLVAIDHYIDAGERVRQILTGDDKNEFVQKLWKIQELHAKLILDVHPIELRTEDNGNRNIYDSIGFKCYLCGNPDTISFPETPIVDDHYICNMCFIKHEPELSKKILESNIKFLEQWDAELTGKDSLPF